MTDMETSCWRKTGRGMMATLIKNLTLMAGFPVLMLLASCSTMHSATQSQKAAIEQLLISEAVLRSLPQDANDIIAIPQGARVAIDTSGVSADQIFLQKTLAGWLGQQGYAIQKNEDKADYRISVIVRSLGTELATVFLVCRPSRASLSLFPCPNWRLYKAQYQTGYAKFHMDIFELPEARSYSRPRLFWRRPISTITRFCFSLLLTQQISNPRRGSARFGVVTSERSSGKMKKGTIWACSIEKK